MPALSKNIVNEQKVSARKVIFFGCCKVSVQIGKVIKRTLLSASENPKNKNNIIFKIYDLTSAYFQLFPMIKNNKKLTLKTIRHILGQLIYNKGVYQAYRIIITENPDLVVVGDDGGICASIIHFCKKRGIPTLSIQVGVLNKPKQSLLNILRKNKYLLWRAYLKIISFPLFSFFIFLSKPRLINLEWGSTNADYYAIAHPRYYDYLIERGVKKEQIFVTGFVLIDSFTNRWLNLSQREIDKIRKKYEIYKNFVLFLTQPLVEDGLVNAKIYKKTIKDIIKIISKFNICILIKPHPRENLDKYAKIFDKETNLVHVFSSREAMLEDLILLCSLSITFFSTSGFYVLAVKKPLITLNIFKTPYENPYTGYPYNIKSLAELEKILNLFIKNKQTIDSTVSYNWVLNQYLYKNDGHAINRIVKLIDSILDKKYNTQT